MGTIIETIKLTPDIMGDTTVCYESLNKVYQICYLTFANKDQLPSHLHNNISSYLVNDNIYGHVVLICSAIDPITYECTPSSVHLDFLSELLYKKFIHKAIIINCDGSKPTEITFKSHPLEHYTTDESEYVNYIQHDVKILSFDLLLYVKKDSTSMNKHASAIYSKEPLCGDVIVVLKTDTEFCELDMDLYTKLLNISLNHMSIRTTTDSVNDMMGIEQQTTGPKPNKYHVLESKMKDSKHDKCGFSSCSKSLSVLTPYFTCGGCQRVFYDSPECQKKDWVFHRKDCSKFHL
jgi:hypothetical protein